MAKSNQSRKQTDAKSFLDESAKADSSGGDVSKSESPEASADQKASQPSPKEPAKAKEVKPAAKVEDVPGKYRKFQKNA